MDEVQYCMGDVYFEKGSEIMGNNEICNSLVFVVQGQVEVQILNNDLEYEVAEVLQQGDIIG